MCDSQKYLAALEYTTRMHEGQFRIGGDAYITHPIAVSEIVRDWGYGEDYQIAALFHDLLEDTQAAPSEIKNLAGDEVMTAVELLTKKKDYVMADYVSAIKNHPIAFRVKAADRLHNLRCALVASEEFKRKYVLETLDWYLDFCPEIPVALKALVRSMDSPLAELSLQYDFVNEWLIKAPADSQKAE